MKNIAYKVLMPIYGVFYRLRYKPTIIGKENIPKKGAFIICGNHKHTRDQMNVMIVTRRVIHYMAKEEYFEGNFAWFFKLAGCIKVDRRIHDAEAKNIALSYLKNGEAVGIFPEGTRNKTLGTPEEVDLLPFKFGAVSLAKKSNALIVPFGISGDYTGKKGNLVCRIGKPFSVRDMELESANEKLRQEILKLMKKSK